MAVTLKAVALAAGVSTAAVSKALHGGGKNVRISEDCANRIRKVAEDLNYRPNAVARNLRGQRTHNVGLIFENFGSFADGPLYYTLLLDGIGQTLFKQHYRLTILPELQSENILGTFGDGQLEGVIWCKLARDEATLQLIHDCPIPIVALNAPAPVAATEAVFVSCDNENGIQLAVRHLLEMGHKKIAFLYEKEDANTPDTVSRCEAFVAAAGGAGTVIEWGWKLTEFENWWAGKPEETAIIGWSERTAGQLLRQCKAAGVSVPDQLSVVGFDSTPFCETTQPRLTAVRQPIQEMAIRATETLLSMIGGNRPPSSSFLFPCSLDVRDSTAPPQSGGVII